MPPKRSTRGKEVAESSRPHQRARRIPNAHDLVFEKPEHRKRYEALAKRKLLPTRYICNETLDKLGLREEIHRMFGNLGMLEFMQFEAPTFEKITLEFLSTVEFKLRRRWNGSETEYYGDLVFQLFGEEHTMSLQEVGAALNLPSVAYGAPPETFAAAEFWTAITGKTGYNPSTGKASGIHNPCFRYAQKGLAFTLFGRGDSTGVAAKRELFFLHCMTESSRVNVAAFAANHLKQVGYASTGDISVGGMITQIADHLNYGRLLIEEPAMEGKKIDMQNLVNQGMIVVHPRYYSLVSRDRHILALPAPNFISIANVANWLYAASSPSLGDSPLRDMEDDTPAEAHFSPPPQSFARQDVGSSSMSQDQWGWVQSEMGALRTEQTRQGVELFRQGVVMDDMQAMMQRLMLHFPHDPPPPPSQ